MMLVFALFPRSASTLSSQVDAITFTLLGVTGFMLIAVFLLIAFFAIRYRHGSPHTRKIEWGGKHAVEWGWTYATFAVFLGIFAWGAYIYFEQHNPPAGSTEITVVGKQWMWKFQHPEGILELNELHVPIGQPILLTLTSQDVIHSFFVPAFRIKQDVIPDRYVHLWFQATKPGTYHLFCTQYCGTFHAEMRGRIIAMSQQDYEEWLETGLAPKGSISMASRGQELFNRFGCVHCHTPNAFVKAPLLNGLYGKTVILSDGTTVIADENYIRESILNPRAKITQGYENIMPPFKGALSDEDVLDLIAYVKSLRGTP